MLLRWVKAAEDRVSVGISSPFVLFKLKRTEVETGYKEYKNVKSFHFFLASGTMFIFKPDSNIRRY